VDSLNLRYFSTRFIGARRIQEMKIQPDVPTPEVDYFQVSLLAFEPALSIPSPSGSPQPGISFSSDL